MPEYRRWRIPVGTCFFTLNLLERHIDALRAAVRRARRERPFRIDAWVVLPGHGGVQGTLSLAQGSR